MGSRVPSYGELVADWLNADDLVEGLVAFVLGVDAEGAEAAVAGLGERCVVGYIGCLLYTSDAADE